MLDAASLFDSDVGDAPYLVYEWDLDGDLDFHDAAGINPTVNGEQLPSQDIDDGAIDHLIGRSDPDWSPGAVGHDLAVDPQPGEEQTDLLPGL